MNLTLPPTRIVSIEKEYRKTGKLVRQPDGTKKGEIEQEHIGWRMVLGNQLVIISQEMLSFDEAKPIYVVLVQP